MPFKVIDCLPIVCRRIAEENVSENERRARDWLSLWQEGRPAGRQAADLGSLFDDIAREAIAAAEKERDAMTLKAAREYERAEKLRDELRNVCEGRDEMARLLLLLEQRLPYAGDDEIRCAGCGGKLEKARDAIRHRETCPLVAVLRKAGVIDSDSEPSPR